jgi:excisionase family DNA binding protein
MHATRANGSRRPFIDLSAVADQLGVNHRHIRRLVHERRIPPVILTVKWDHLLRFDPDEIDAWVEAARVPVER